MRQCGIERVPASRVSGGSGGSGARMISRFGFKVTDKITTCPVGVKGTAGFPGSASGQASNFDSSRVAFSVLGWTGTSRKTQLPSNSVQKYKGIPAASLPEITSENQLIPLNVKHRQLPLAVFETKTLSS